MSTNGVKIVFGAAIFGLISTLDEVPQWLETLGQLGVDILDTAYGYGTSEERLGENGAAEKFTIDTKHPGGIRPEPATREEVIKLGKESLQRLQTESVDIYYLHCPDARVPVKDMLSGINELYKQGAFKRFGLSNFSADEVEEVVRVAKEKGFVLPTVYQGNYNAVARHTETEILPILRKHNIVFYAYIPIAGGFLSKSKDELTADPQGRFGEQNPLQLMYNGMYNRPSILPVLDVWGQIAHDEGVSRVDLAYRWITYHSALRGDLGDALIVGARKEDQLRESVAAIKSGPLSKAFVKRIDAVWEDIKGDAYLDNGTVFRQLQGKK